MAVILEARELWKTYSAGDGVDALRGVSLTAEEGEFIALAGPSGSGKSTLLHILGAMDKPTKGEVRVNGKSLTGAAGAEKTYVRCREIGFVFQTFNLLPTYTALENVEIVMRFAGVPRRERRIRALELLEQVGLENRVHHLPKQLSGGQCQRVAIARALANRPSILLADEPTGNLDSSSGEKIAQLLLQIKSRGLTVILATHNMELAEKAGRILHMRDGMLAQQG